MDNKIAYNFELDFILQQAHEGKLTTKIIYDRVNDLLVPIEVYNRLKTSSIIKEVEHLGEFDIVDNTNRVVRRFDNYKIILSPFGKTIYSIMDKYKYPYEKALEYSFEIYQIMKKDDIKFELAEQQYIKSLEKKKINQSKKERQLNKINDIIVIIMLALFTMFFVYTLIETFIGG
jgi:hypothetical protein